MGQQIQITLDKNDGQRVITWLFDNFGLFFTPYLFDGPTLRPQKLEACSEKRLLLFPQQAITRFSEHTIYSETFNKYLVDPSFSHGSAFEWSQSLEIEPGVFAVGGGGRFFFVKNEASPLNTEMTRIVRRLFAYVKMTSPLQTDRRHPNFIGSSLSAHVQDGTAILRHANGSNVDLIQNPKYHKR